MNIRLFRTSETRGGAPLFLPYRLKTLTDISFYTIIYGHNKVERQQRVSLN